MSAALKDGNRSAVNLVFIVRLKRKPSQEWHVLAADAEEAMAVVLGEHCFLDFWDLTAEEAKA